jgi:hypothetical protein
MKITKSGNEYVLEAEQWVPRPLEELFPFFAKAENLETLTPKFLGFRVLKMSTPAIEKGTLIDYRIKVHGVPMGWTTLIEEWTPGKSFVDTQLKGPYSFWHHTHSFESKDGGTMLRDRVRFRLPLGFLGDFFGGWLVRRDVTEIFAYRRATIERLFKA